MTDCYCVCHNSMASRAYCEHCHGYNSAGRVPRCMQHSDKNAAGTCAKALPCADHPKQDYPREETLGLHGVLMRAAGTVGADINIRELHAIVTKVEEALAYQTNIVVGTYLAEIWEHGTERLYQGPESR